MITEFTMGGLLGFLLGVRYGRRQERGEPFITPEERARYAAIAKKAWARTTSTADEAAQPPGDPAPAQS
jgi:hypothetical protein